MKYPKVLTLLLSVVVFTLSLTNTSFAKSTFYPLNSDSTTYLKVLVASGAAYEGEFIKEEKNNLYIKTYQGEQKLRYSHIDTVYNLSDFIVDTPLARLITKENKVYIGEFNVLPNDSLALITLDGDKYFAKSDVLKLFEHNDSNNLQKRITKEHNKNEYIHTTFLKLQLKNGDSIEGKHLSEDSQTIKIKTLVNEHQYNKTEIDTVYNLSDFNVNTDFVRVLTYADDEFVAYFKDQNADALILADDKKVFKLPKADVFKLYESDESFDYFIPKSEIKPAKDTLTYVAIVRSNGGLFEGSFLKEEEDKYYILTDQGEFGTPISKIDTIYNYSDFSVSTEYADIVTRDHQNFSGIYYESDGNTISLRDDDATIHTFDKKDVLKVKESHLYQYKYSHLFEQPTLTYFTPSEYVLLVKKDGYEFEGEFINNDFKNFTIKTSNGKVNFNISQIDTVYNLSDYIVHTKKAKVVTKQQKLYKGTLKEIGKDSISIREGKTLKTFNKFDVFKIYDVEDDIVYEDNTNKQRSLKIESHKMMTPFVSEIHNSTYYTTTSAYAKKDVYYAQSIFILQNKIFVQPFKNVSLSANLGFYSSVGINTHFKITDQFYLGTRTHFSSGWNTAKLTYGVAGTFIVDRFNMSVNYTPNINMKTESDIKQKSILRMALSINLKPQSDLIIDFSYFDREKIQDYREVYYDDPDDGAPFDLGLTTDKPFSVLHMGIRHYYGRTYTMFGILHTEYIEDFHGGDYDFRFNILPTFSFGIRLK